MPTSESGPPRAGQNTLEALGVRSAPPPPEGFNPIQATDSELRAYGYPARPDIELYPELHERWNQLMSLPISFIEPEFAVMVNRGSSTRDVVAQTDSGQAVAFPTDPNYVWAGSVLRGIGAQNPVNFVAGVWTIPHIVDPGAPYAFELMTWVGIDGGGGGGGGFGAPGSADVLQAGVYQAGNTYAAAGTYTFFEWYGDPLQITNLLVRPGDTFFCSITAYSATEAHVFLWDITTSAATSTIHTATGGKRLAGDTVEWVLETPSYESNNQLLAGTLAKYGKVYFDQCIAFTKNNNVLEGGNGNMLNQYDVNGQLISAAYPITDQLFVVDYARTSWSTT